MKIILSKRIGDFLDDLQQDFPEAEFIHTSDDDDAVSKAVDVDVSFDIRTRGFVEAATQLQWIQTVSAGVNGAPFELLKKRGITLTNASANYGPNMADHTLALMLMLSRQIHIVQRRMRDKGWKCGVPTPDPGELAGQDPPDRRPGRDRDGNGQTCRGLRHAGYGNKAAHRSPQARLRGFGPSPRSLARPPPAS